MIVTLYARPGCHLCEDVRALLDELAPEGGFTLREINIENDGALFERYRFEIPVVLIDGSEIARGRIDERALIAALDRRPWGA
jgi:glutaredoxin